MARLGPSYRVRPTRPTSEVVTTRSYLAQPTPPWLEKALGLDHLDLVEGKNERTVHARRPPRRGVEQ